MYTCFDHSFAMIDPLLIFSIRVAQSAALVQHRAQTIEKYELEPDALRVLSQHTITFLYYVRTSSRARVHTDYMFDLFFCLSFSVIATFCVTNSGGIEKFSAIISSTVLVSSYSSIIMRKETPCKSNEIRARCDYNYAPCKMCWNSRDKKHIVCFSLPKMYARSASFIHPLILYIARFRSHSECEIHFNPLSTGDKLFFRILSPCRQLSSDFDMLFSQREVKW